jgi:hypothetical protein
MKTNEVVKTLKLSDTKNGVITVSNIEEPYGNSGSARVVSIGINLKGDDQNPEWKVHVPYEDLDGVIEALKEAKAKFDK